MKIRLFTLCTTLIALSLLFAAYSSTASLPSAASTTGLSQAAELAIGTLRLEDSDQAPNSEQASQLLVLWKAYQSLSNSDSTAQAELDGLVDQIQENLTAEQNQAIAAMQLDSQSQAEIIQSLGTAIASGSSQSAALSTSAGQPDPGTHPGGDAGMPLDATAMQSGDQVSSQPSTGVSATNRLQQISPQLVSAVIESLSAQLQTVSS